MGSSQVLGWKGRPPQSSKAFPEVSGVCSREEQDRSSAAQKQLNRETSVGQKGHHITVEAKGHTGDGISHVSPDVEETGGERTQLSVFQWRALWKGGEVRRTGRETFDLAGHKNVEAMGSLRAFEWMT